jgi:hypothetical protein
MHGIDIDCRQFVKENKKGTQQFEIPIIHLSTAVPNTPKDKVIRNQVTKAGTSICSKRCYI